MFSLFYLALVLLALARVVVRFSARDLIAAVALVAFTVSGTSLDRLPLTALLLTVGLWLITPRAQAGDGRDATGVRLRARRRSPAECASD